MFKNKDVISCGEFTISDRSQAACHISVLAAFNLEAHPCVRIMARIQDQFE